MYDADHLKKLLATSAAKLFACSNDVDGCVKITAPCLRANARQVEMWLVDDHDEWYLTDAGRTIGGREITSIGLSLVKDGLRHSEVQLHHGELRAPFLVERAAWSVLCMAQAIAQVEVLLARHGSEFLLRCGELVMDLLARRTYCQERPIHLTPTEFDILMYLVIHQDRLVGYEELDYIVWGQRGNRSKLRVWIYSLRQKLPQSVRIETVRGSGYVISSLTIRGANQAQHSLA